MSRLPQGGLIDRTRPLAFRFDGDGTRWLGLHLGMSGRLRVEPLRGRLGLRRVIDRTETSPSRIPRTDA